MVSAAVLGMVTGAAACGGARTAVSRPSSPASSAPAANDKSACGNHPGSSCAALDAPK
jgi:hypothetical protein